MAATEQQRLERYFKLVKQFRKTPEDVFRKGLADVRSVTENPRLKARIDETLGTGPEKLTG
jgi:hypothetical protein